MSDFLATDEVLVPQASVDEAMLWMRQAGEKRCEGIALWAGTAEGSTVTVRRTIIPDQRAFRSEDGVCVIADDIFLSTLNRWLYANGLRLIAQLHSHPSEAYHSSADDENAIVTTNGALSIVVPDFARAPFDVLTAAVYRKEPRRGWVRLSEAAAALLLRVKD